MKSTPPPEQIQVSVRAVQVVAGLVGRESEGGALDDFEQHRRLHVWRRGALSMIRSAAPPASTRLVTDYPVGVRRGSLYHWITRWRARAPRLAPVAVSFWRSICCMRAVAMPAPWSWSKGLPASIAFVWRVSPRSTT